MFPLPQARPRLVLATITVLVLGLVGVSPAAEPRRSPPTVHAREISRLSATLEGDPSEKARLSAAVALGRLKDPRGVPGLIRGLSDPSAVVRGVSASALGVIGDRRALPALQRALDDPNPNVRARATRAIERIEEKQAEQADPPPTASRPSSASVRVVPRESPRRGSKKEVRLRVVASNRGTPGAGRPYGPTLRASLETQLGDSPGVEVVAEEPRFVVDGSITVFKRRTKGKLVEIECEVKLTVSEPSGRIVGMVTGQATVQAPRTRTPEGARELDEQAVAGAVDGARGKLLAYLSTVP